MLYGDYLYVKGRAAPSDVDVSELRMHIWFPDLFGKLICFYFLFFPSENYLVRWSSSGLPKDIDRLHNLRAVFTVSASKDVHLNCSPFSWLFLMTPVWLLTAQERGSLGCRDYLLISYNNIAAQKPSGSLVTLRVPMTKMYSMRLSMSLKHGS